MKVCICSSANADIRDEYYKDCENALNYVLKYNDLVFGAYDTGLMGLCYKIAKENNKRITGIAPEVYADSFDRLECDEEIVTMKIMDSTKAMLDVSDAVIIMPGGFGTVYEFFAAIQMIVCKESNIPIILYNSCGYYDSLIESINKMYQTGFASSSTVNYFKIANNVKELKNILQ